MIGRTPWTITRRTHLPLKTSEKGDVILSDFDWGVLAGFSIGAIGTLILVTVFEALGVVEWLIVKMDSWVASRTEDE